MGGVKMKQISFLLLSFFIQIAIANEDTQTPDNPASTNHEDTQTLDNPTTTEDIQSQNNPITSDENIQTPDNPASTNHEDTRTLDNSAATEDTQARNNTRFSDAMKKLDDSLSTKEPTQNTLSIINPDNMPKHRLSTDIPPESRITFEEGSFDDPPVYFYRGGSLYSTGRYCNYPYPHISPFGDCSYYYPRFSFQLRFKDTPSARERYIEYLFNQAYLGHTEAQFKLGVRYQQGMGVSQNLPEAYAWFSTALHYGHDPAQYMLDKLKGQMTVHQVEAGGERSFFLVEDINKSIEQRHEWLKENIFKDYPELSEFDEPDNQ